MSHLPKCFCLIILWWDDEGGSSFSDVAKYFGLIVIYIIMLQIVENTKEFKQKLKASIRRKSDLFRNGDFGTDSMEHSFPEVTVQLGATGFEERYYKYKFSAESPGEIESKRKEVVCLAIYYILILHLLLANLSMFSHFSTSIFIFF
ncbi:hypothetical protein RchiOBHm_Chr5g0047421 [Rosa chinensis]|uniref:Xrn1 helical domain-containing protein n=1 Tax=Rosa chinensis TaxID=74649 RepID=A0A2P6QEC3_ROSCH|nr:hypothetical protein RchiOBHm_Chr5g0047421 [Rosa chinensis]